MMLECAAAAGPEVAAGFTLGEDGARWTVMGALTFATVGPMLAAAEALPLPSTGVVECGGIAAVDSAAVALLLAVKRRATAMGVKLVLADLPDPVTTLAALYGVEEILEA